MGVLLALLKLLAIGGLYFAALYRYAPSDVTQGIWAFKLATILMFARIFGLFMVYHAIKFIFFSKGKSLGRRIISTMFAVPFYALVTALVMLTLNGYKDDETHTTSWHTNLVFFRDFKLACLVAGIDDYQIRRGDNAAQLVLLPGILCSELADDGITGESLMPYDIKISAGSMSIPRVIAVEKLL